MSSRQKNISYGAKIKSRLFIASLLSACTVFMSGGAVAQSNAGQVIFTEDFGTGVFPTGQPLPAGVTNFTFFEPPQPANFDAAAPNNGIVNDGFYTIGTNTQQAFSSWANIEDNTPGDVNGLMMIVNARENELVNGDVVEDEFFRQTVSLSPNTSFDFLAFLTPTNSVGDEEFCRTNFGALILPNVRFSIQNLSGTVLAEATTGEIPFSPTPSFESFELNFSTNANASDVQIVLSNIAPGGCGNDIAIDDITFRISITAEALDDSATVDDTSAAIPSLFNVVTNDTLDGAPFPASDAPGSNTTLVLAEDTPLPPELTFDVLTGDVGVVQNAPNGIYSFDYLICETNSFVNCDRATATVTIAAQTLNAQDDSETVNDTSEAILDVINVLNNDTDNGGPINGFSLSLAPDETLPVGLTFDLATGNVGTTALAPNGTFTFDYQLCQTEQAINCDIAKVTIIIDAPELPPGGGVCPAGQRAVTQQGFAVDAFRSDNQNVGGEAATNAIGEILAPGATDSGAQTEEVFFPSIDLEFTAENSPFLPENSQVIISVAQFFGNDGLSLVQSSTDGMNFTDIGTIGFGNSTGTLVTTTVSNTIIHVPITIPAGGARYIRLDHQSGGYRVDGGERNEICQIVNLGPQLSAIKLIENAIEGEYSIPGKDVVYTIRVENIGDNTVDSDTIFLIDEWRRLKL